MNLWFFIWVCDDFVLNKFPKLQKEIAEEEASTQMHGIVFETAF